jgi:hypothetical protein
LVEEDFSLRAFDTVFAGLGVSCRRVGAPQTAGKSLSGSQNGCSWASAGFHLTNLVSETDKTRRQRQRPDSSFALQQERILR